MELYRSALSGHCHRVEMFLSLLSLNCEIIDIDLPAGDHKKPEFLQKNFWGEVPVLCDDGATISDSNAILVWLATKYDSERRWYPNDPCLMAEVQRWLSVAAGKIAFGPNFARLAKVFGKEVDWEQAAWVTKDLYNGMNAWLEGRQWLVGDCATIADLACYSFISSSAEGGIPLDEWININKWLNNVEGMDNFQPFMNERVAA